ncbi:MAG: ABC transporter permease [Gaiellaceae bacterium]
MTWIGFVAKNLMRRRVRTALTAAGVSIGVGLIVALLSITAGVQRTANQLIHIGRADFGLFQGGVSDLTRSLLPASMETQIAKQPGVSQVAGIKFFITKVGGQDSFLVLGLDPNEFPAKRLTLVTGRRPHGGREILLGDSAADTLKAGVGGTLRVAGKSFRVVGLFHTGDSFEDNGAVLPIAMVEAMTGHPGDVTTIAVTVVPGQAAATVAKQVADKFGIQRLQEPGQAVKIDTSSRLLISAGWIFSILALIVGGIGVMNTMAMSVFERTREIGILRAVGWPAWRIGLLIVSEALGICLLALGIGLGVGVLAAHLFTAYGLLSALVVPDFTAGVFAWGLAFALGVGLVGAVYPTWRAVALTPIEALRQE